MNGARVIQGEGSKERVSHELLRDVIVVLTSDASYTRSKDNVKTSNPAPGVGGTA